MPTRPAFLLLLAPIIFVLSVAAGLSAGFAAGWLAQQAQLPGWLAGLVIAVTGVVAFLMTFAGLRLAQDAHSSPFERVQQVERYRRSLIGGVVERLLPPEFHWEQEVFAGLSYALRFSWPLLLILLVGGLRRDVSVPTHEIPRSLLGLLPWLAGLSAVVLLGKMIVQATYTAHAWRRLAICWGTLYVGVRFIGDPMQDIMTGNPTFCALAVVSVFLTVLFVRWSARPLQDGLYDNPAANVPADALLDARSVVQLAHQDAAQLLLFGLKSRWAIRPHRLTADPRAKRWYDPIQTIDQQELEWRALLHLIGSLQLKNPDLDLEATFRHNHYHACRYAALTALLLASRTGYTPVSDPETGQVILPARLDAHALKQHHASILRSFLTANADLHQQLSHTLLHSPTVSREQLTALLKQVKMTAGLPNLTYDTLGKCITFDAFAVAKHVAYDACIITPRLN